MLRGRAPTATGEGEGGPLARGTGAQQRDGRLQIGKRGLLRDGVKSGKFKILYPSKIKTKNPTFI